MLSELQALKLRGRSVPCPTTLSGAAGAKNLANLAKEKAALERALWETRQQLDNGRNLAAKLRNAGMEINPHGLGKEINETLPADIARMEQRLAEIARDVKPPEMNLA